MDTTYKIGDWVEVKSRVEFYYDANKMRQTREIPYSEPWKGQVVGLATRILGEYYAADTYPGPYDSITNCDAEYEPAGLIWNKTIRVWLIRRGMLNRPVEALTTGLQSTTPEKELPWIWNNSHKWSNSDRSYLSKESQDWPRDAKGRWMPLKKGK